MKDELGLDYPVLSDEDLKLIRKVELVDPQFPKALRGFAVLDKNGKVLHSEEIDPFGEQASAIFEFASKKVADGK
ncbi:Alkyl hydroperoxide reductase subunit C/ Thiol specific antioxidant domain-containing protein [Mesobacillus zeae]